MNVKRLELSGIGRDRAEEIGDAVRRQLTTALADPGGLDRLAAGSRLRVTMRADPANQSPSAGHTAEKK